MPGQRYLAVDALRGLIMMVMALDHASAFIARQHASEFWSGAMSAYTSAFPFLTRWVTHLCAPGFFFLLGAGVYWFGRSREAAGWTQAAVRRRLLLRGVVVLVLAQMLETPVMFLQGFLKPAALSLNIVTAPPPNDGSALVWGFITMSGLGLCLLACAMLLQFRPEVWLATSAVCVLATNSLLPADGRPGGWWKVVLLAPGIADGVIAVYPLLPWLAGAAAGMYFAYWWNDGRRTQVWMLGAALLALGLALRAAGGWGNIRLPRDASWIEFLNNVKYPPSLVFWCVSLGIDLLLLGALLRLPAAWHDARSPWMVFGQTPLFFYFSHFYLLLAIGYFGFPEAASLEGTYAVWILTLVMLYPVCAGYRRFKLGKPVDSLWRMF